MGHHSHHREPFTYSPNEVGVVGFDRAQVLDFAKRLVTTLGRERRAALVIEGGEAEAHLQEAPLPPLEETASSSLTASAAGYTIVGSGELDRWTGLDLHAQADIVVAAAGAATEMTTLVIVDHAGRTLDAGFLRDPDRVAAYVQPDETSDRLRDEIRKRAGSIPVLGTQDVERAETLVLESLRRRALSAPLYGLVLGGGRSTRMKRDKAAIEYHGMPQVRYAHRLLERYCERVFVSNRADQAEDPLFEGLEQIHDRFVGFGPMGGMLSALHTYPEAAWLVLGCDLPFVDESVLGALLDARDPLMLATCYTSAHDGLPEPLCAVYEPRYRRRLHQFLASGRDCPRKALINSRAKQVELADPRALDNINSPEELETARMQIKEETTDGR